MKRILLVLLCLLSAPVMATHIVGGEFELVYKGMSNIAGYRRYTISMVLYFDERNGNPGARDQQVIVRIFRKRDNAIMENAIVLDLYELTDVQYNAPPRCSSGSSLVTDRIFYTYLQNGMQGEYLLREEDYDDPAGYYISWERCCRNYNIDNIFSEDPNSGTGRYAGQTFYMEFPPMIKDGQPFINSAPRLFRPLSDYACRDRLYSVDFGGVDPDGDSLVYSMVIPMNTKSGDALPQGGLPRPGPYPNVDYRSGFSLDNIMSGLPDLNISRTGTLSVVPKIAGLFVFAVLCEEYRDGEKIGEIRRDFQLLVLANCPAATAPVVEGKRRNDASYVKNALNVAFTNQATDAERCIDIRVTDPDAAIQEEKIEILAVAVNFEDDDVDEVLPDIPTATLKNGSAASFSVCFPQCPYKLGIYTLDIVVRNESCGGYLTDTIRVDVNVEPPPNNVPVFNPQVIEKTVQEGGEPFQVTFTGTDADGDNLVLIPPKLAKDFAKYGFSWNITENVAGRVSAAFRWDTECDKYDFSVKRDFDFYYILDDQDVCDVTPDDTLHFKLKRRIDDFHDPVIDYAPDRTMKKITLNEKLYTTLNFNTLISDKDNDKLEVVGVGKGFDLATLGALYPAQTLEGNTSVETTKPFTWWLDCAKIDISKKNKFEFYLIVTDKYNVCDYHLADTLDITLNVLPPDNNKPLLQIAGQSDDLDEEITLGDELVLPIVGTDTDVNPLDMLTIELIDAAGNVTPADFTFTSTPSTSPVTGNFTWKPTCDIYREANIPPDAPLINDYIFKFRLMDNRCFNVKGDTVTLNLKVKDVVNDPADFIPPNIITPHLSPDQNDFFAMVKVDDDGKLVSILPKDNCRGTFVNISVRNRWGREVYYSEDRDFKWYALDEPSGAYFYLLKYTDKEYKGIISVLGGDGSEDNR